MFLLVLQLSNIKDRVPHRPPHEEHAHFVGTKKEIRDLWKNNRVTLTGTEEKKMCNFGWGQFMGQAVAWKPKTGLSYGTGAGSLGGESCCVGQSLYPATHQVTNKQRWNKALPHSQYPRCLGKYFSKYTLIFKSWRCTDVRGHLVRFTWSINYLFLLHTKYLFSLCILG